MRNICCFVACAFGKADVNAIYNNAIEPVLRSASIIARRVDLEEFNEDIDDKIIELIETSEICIADLTYARPSVYYEAGYFNGLNKPVIFTSRGDHFIQKDNDTEGNRAIHFDLKMKNIIDWTSTKKVKTFKSKLASRIKHVTKPIRAEIEEKSIREKATREYSSYSQRRKLKTLSKVALQKVMANKAKTLDYDTGGYTKPDTYISLRSGRTLYTLFFTSSATKEYLKYVSHDRILMQNEKNIRGVTHSHIFITSLRNIPSSRIEDSYPDIYRISSDLMSYSEDRWRSVMCYYHFLSNPSSEFEYANEFTRMMELIKGI
jgi:nucleoside 2-deoxyribosyltransferase